MSSMAMNAAPPAQPVEQARNVEAELVENGTEWDTLKDEVPFNKPNAEPERIRIPLNMHEGRAVNREYAVEILRRSVREAKDAEKFGAVERLAKAILDEKNDFSSEEKDEVREIMNSDVYKEEKLRAEINRGKEAIAQKEKALEDQIAEHASLLSGNAASKLMNHGKINQIRKSIEETRKEIAALQGRVNGFRTDLIQLMGQKQVGEEAPVETANAEPAPRRTLRIPVVHNTETAEATEGQPVNVPESEPEVAQAEVEEETVETTQAEAKENKETEKPVEKYRYSKCVKDGSKGCEMALKDKRIISFLYDSDNRVLVNKEHAVDSLEDRIMNGKDVDRVAVEAMKLSIEITKKGSDFSKEEQARVKELLATPEYREKRLLHNINNMKKTLERRKNALNICEERYNELKENSKNIVLGFLNRHELRQARERSEWTRRDIENAEKSLKEYEKALEDLRVEGPKEQVKREPKNVEKQEESSEKQENIDSYRDMIRKMVDGAEKEYKKQFSPEEVEDSSSPESPSKEQVEKMVEFMKNDLDNGKKKTFTLNEEEFSQLSEGIKTGNMDVVSKFMNRGAKKEESGQNQ